MHLVPSMISHRMQLNFRNTIILPMASKCNIPQIDRLKALAIHHRSLHRSIHKEITQVTPQVQIENLSAGYTPDQYLNSLMLGDAADYKDFPDIRFMLHLISPICSKDS